jgi:tripartite-type tricarboxylate transporter receptor subunit TctC
MNGALYSLPYDVLNDFSPISPLVTAPFVLYARKTMPAKDLDELFVWLKAAVLRGCSSSAITSLRKEERH